MTTSEGIAEAIGLVDKTGKTVSVFDPKHGGNVKNEQDKQKLYEALVKRSAKEPVSARALKNVYGPYAVDVLRAHVMEETDAGFVLAPGKSLPALDAFRGLADAIYEVSVETLIVDAFTAIEELAGEMREGYENMEAGNLGATQRCQTFGETADTLEAIDQPDLPEVLGEITTARYPTVTKATSRAHRASEAASYLNLAAARIEGWVEDKREMLDERDDDDNAEVENELDLDDLETLVEELRDAAGNVEGCEFPGMFG